MISPVEVTIPIASEIDLTQSRLPNIIEDQVPSAEDLIQIDTQAFVKIIKDLENRVTELQLSDKNKSLPSYIVSLENRVAELERQQNQQNQSSSASPSTPQLNVSGSTNSLNELDRPNTGSKDQEIIEGGKTSKLSMIALEERILNRIRQEFESKQLTNNLRMESQISTFTLELERYNKLLQSRPTNVELQNCLLQIQTLEKKVGGQMSDLNSFLQASLRDRVSEEMVSLLDEVKNNRLQNDDIYKSIEKQLENVNNEVNNLRDFSNSTLRDFEEQITEIESTTNKSEENLEEIKENYEKQKNLLENLESSLSLSFQTIEEMKLDNQNIKKEFSLLNEKIDTLNDHFTRLIADQITEKLEILKQFQLTTENKLKDIEIINDGLKESYKELFTYTRENFDQVNYNIKLIKTNEENMENNIKMNQNNIEEIKNYEILKNFDIFNNEITLLKEENIKKFDEINEHKKEFNTFLTQTNEIIDNFKEQIDIRIPGVFNSHFLRMDNLENTIKNLESDTEYLKEKIIKNEKFNVQLQELNLSHMNLTNKVEEDELSILQLQEELEQIVTKQEDHFNRITSAEGILENVDNQINNRIYILKDSLIDTINEKQEEMNRTLTQVRDNLDLISMAGEGPGANSGVVQGRIEMNKQEYSKPVKSSRGKRTPEKPKPSTREREKEREKEREREREQFSDEYYENPSNFITSVENFTSPPLVASQSAASAKKTTPEVISRKSSIHKVPSLDNFNNNPNNNSNNISNPSNPNIGLGLNSGRSNIAESPREDSSKIEKKIMNWSQINQAMSPSPSQISARSDAPITQDSIIQTSSTPLLNSNSNSSINSYEENQPLDSLTIAQNSSNISSSVYIPGETVSYSPYHPDHNHSNLSTLANGEVFPSSSILSAASKGTLSIPSVSGGTKQIPLPASLVERADMLAMEYGNAIGAPITSSISPSSPSTFENSQFSFSAEAQLLADICINYENLSAKKKEVIHIPPNSCIKMIEISKNIAHYIAERSDFEMVEGIIVENQDANVVNKEIIFDESYIVKTRSKKLDLFLQSVTNLIISSYTGNQPGIVRIEARSLFLSLIRKCIDLFLSRYGQVLIASQSGSLGRKKLTTCLSCDRPLNNKLPLKEAVAYSKSEINSLGMIEATNSLHMSSTLSPRHTSGWLNENSMDNSIQYIDNNNHDFNNSSYSNSSTLRPRTSHSILNSPQRGGMANASGSVGNSGSYVLRGGFKMPKRPGTGNLPQVK